MPGCCVTLAAVCGTRQCLQCLCSELHGHTVFTLLNHDDWEGRRHRWDRYNVCTKLSVYVPCHILINIQSLWWLTHTHWMTPFYSHWIIYAIDVDPVFVAEYGPHVLIMFLYSFLFWAVFQKLICAKIKLDLVLCSVHFTLFSPQCMSN